jgi:hypothetical protein
MGVPLDVLMSHALLDLTRSCERAGVDEVVLWANLLRALDDGRNARKALPAAVRLSKRVVESTVKCVVRRGWASVDGDAVVLAADGRAARGDWTAAIARAEAAWPHAKSLRPPVEAFVSQLPLEHPHYPCGYGTADWRITGGPGVDWKPVVRDGEADTVSGLPLLALLSQALVGFTYQYERRVPFAMLVGLYLDAAFATDSIDLADAPRVLDIRGNGRSSLERHGAVTVTEGRVRLTRIGQQLRDAYRPTTADVESAMRGAPALRAALEGLGLEHAGHADHPDVHFVGGGVGFAEVSARG